MSSTQGGIISLNFGGCGVRLGASTTRLYAEDFGIGMDGSIASNRMREGYYYDVFFSEQKGSSDQDNKKFLSRSLYFDSDPDSLDSITGMAGLIPELCKPVWADGLVLEPAYTYTKGQEYFDKSKDYFEQSVRVLAEQTDKLQGFIGTASASGGFSSGYSVRALTLLKDTFGVKKSFIGNTLLPDLSLGLEAAEATNTLLLTSAVRSGLYDAQYVFQNIPAQRLLSKYQIVSFPTFKELNSLMVTLLAMNYSSMYLEGSSLTDLSEIVTAMVPYPTINSIEMYSGRLYPRHHPQLNRETSLMTSVENIAENCLLEGRGEKSFKLFGSFIFAGGRCIAPKEMGQHLIQELRRRFKYVDWSPCGLKYRIKRCDMLTTKCSLLGLATRHALLLTNSGAMGTVFDQLLQIYSSGSGELKLEPEVLENAANAISDYKEALED